MENFTKERYAITGNTISKKLQRRNFSTIICQNINEAKTKALSLIPLDKTVGFGGSLTLEKLGLIDALYARGQKMIDREKTHSNEQRQEVMKQALTADYFLTSLNGISEDGVLVNIDRVGNRIAALTFGPDHVFAFVGMNKIYGNLDTTIEMVRKKTAPLNSFRLGLESTPCVKRGQCGNCLLDECICNTIALTRHSFKKDRITIFLILEDVGM